MYWHRRWSEAYWDPPAETAVGVPVCTVVTAEPYDVEALLGDTQLAVYDRGEAAHVAAAEALPDGSAPGSLPVPVGSHGIGDGGALDPCR